MAYAKSNFVSFTFSRWLHGDLAVQWGCVCDAVSNITLTCQDDMVIWKWGPKKKYSVKSAYKHLSCSAAGPDLSFIWRCKLPLKIKVFL